MGCASISIPLWCDCDGWKRHLGFGVLTDFNPTMVRLRLRYERVYLLVDKFQSHYGAIATSEWFGCLSARGERFQSHYGAIAT